MNVRKSLTIYSHVDGFMHGQALNQGLEDRFFSINTRMLLRSFICKQDQTSIRNHAQTTDINPVLEPPNPELKCPTLRVLPRPKSILLILLPLLSTEAIEHLLNTSTASASASVPSGNLSIV
jgi:hypothetical protein